MSSRPLAALRVGGELLRAVHLSSLASVRDSELVIGTGGLTVARALRQTRDARAEVRMRAEEALVASIDVAAAPAIRALQRGRGILDGLGAPSALGLYEWLTGCDVERLLAQSRSYLQGTAEAYAQWRYAHLRETADGPPRVADVLRAAVAPVRRFAEREIGALVGTLVSEYGWPLQSVRYSLDSDAGLRGGAWCEPGATPDDVRVCTGPITDDERVRDLLHESAHAAQFASTARGSALDDRDDGLLEAWGVAYESAFVLEDPGSLVPVLSGPISAAPLDLVLARLQIARLMFAARICADGHGWSATELFAAHREVFVEVVGAVPAPLEWMRDIVVVPGADRVRSWMVGAQLVSWLRASVTRHGWPGHWRVQSALWRSGAPSDGERWLHETLGFVPEVGPWVTSHCGATRAVIETSAL